MNDTFDFGDYDFSDEAESNPVNLPKQKEVETSFDFDLYDTEEISEPEEQEEGLLTTVGRYAAQIPKGLAQVSLPGVATNLISTIASGESLAELDELEERLPELKAKFPQFKFPEKIDREKYLDNLQKATETFPTVSNIASGIEAKTGIPLEAKTRGQKFVEFAAGASKIAPKDFTFRGMKASLPAPVLGTGVAAAKEVMVEAGVPEPLADLASFAILKEPTPGAGKISIGAKTKPSGLKERGFEGVKKTREVSEGKISQINRALEEDFKGISDKIIAESPVGETAKNLSENAAFKQESRALLDDAQKIANRITKPIEVSKVEEAYIEFLDKNKKGFSSSEYEKSYAKNLQERFDSFKGDTDGKLKAGQLVEQYRKNNSELGEYFEPGASKSQNRGKRDAILDENRAIATAMEKAYPESELVPVFKEGNERWTKIMDVEAIDSFVDNIFEGKVNFKEAQKFFDDPNLQRVFKRSLGEKGYKNFEQLTKDMLSSEKAYKNLKVAKAKGFSDLAEKGAYYFINPKLGAAKSAVSLAKQGYRTFVNTLLDKPKIKILHEKAFNALKAGDYKVADRLVRELDTKVKDTQKSKESSFKEFQSRQKGKEDANFSNVQEPVKKKTLTPKEEFFNKAFIEISEGKKPSDMQKNLLKDSQVGVMETRGRGEQFHGTKKPIDSLGSEIYDYSSDQNIFGPGFYTTDALDIASGYTKKRSASTGKAAPTIYNVKEKTPQKLYDIEIPIGSMKEKWKKSFSPKSESAILEALESKSVNSVRDVYEFVTDFAVSQEYAGYEAQELFDEISEFLRRQGFDGISHRGGLLTNSKEHKVKIYWKPENLSIEEISIPKNLKKIDSSARKNIK